MMSASAIVFALCAPSLAQPAPAPAGPPMKIDLTVKVGTATRVHQIVISDDGCGHVQAKTPDYEDDIRVCSVVKRDGVRLEASWNVRSKLTEYTMSWTAAVAPGGIVDTTSAGARFTLAMK